MTRNFPFTIRQVAEILGLKIRYEAPNGNMDADCPFCKKKSKLNLNAAKNVFRCNFCNEYGGMIPLYAKILDISNSEANHEICEILGCTKNTAPENNVVVLNTAKREDNEIIHQTYSMLLSLLSLATPHKEHLSSRGFSSEQITQFGYKSVPAFGQKRLCEKLISSGCTLEGVPGFYRENDEWNVKLKAPGILIPVCGIDGKIAGMQIRLDKPVNNRKYIWFSSNGLDGGTSSGAPVHFIGDVATKRFFVTDGALKGTLAHVLTGCTFVCVPGEKSLKGLDEMLTYLKTSGAAEVVEAFDIKKLSDEHAAESAANLREKLSACGFKVATAEWCDKSLRSVDEYFLHRKNAKKNHVRSVDIAAVAV